MKLSPASFPFNSLGNPPEFKTNCGFSKDILLKHKMKILIKNNANHFPENFPASKFSLPFVHFSINLNFLSIFQEIVLRRRTRKNTKENYLLFSLRNFPAFLLASEITFPFIDFQFRVALLFSTHHTICFLYKNKVAGILYGAFSYTPKLQ
jgi:hypothetical protein